MVTESKPGCPLELRDLHPLKQLFGNKKESKPQMEMFPENTNASKEKDQ